MYALNSIRIYSVINRYGSIKLHACVHKTRDRFHLMVFVHSNLHTHTTNDPTCQMNRIRDIMVIFCCCDCVSFSLCVCVSPTLLFSLHWPHSDSIWCHSMLYIHYGNFRLSVLLTETHTIHNYLIRILSFGYSHCLQFMLQRTHILQLTQNRTHIYSGKRICFYYTLDWLLLPLPTHNGSPRLRNSALENEFIFCC